MDYLKYYKKTKVEIAEPIEVDERESKFVDQSIYVLLLLTLFFVPLFIKAHIGEFVSPKLTFLSTGIQSDIFSYYKYIFLVIATILISILYMYKVLFLPYHIKKNIVNAFTAIFAFLILLSAVFSPYKSLALFGMFNRHEGTLTYVCYIIIFFITANMAFSRKQLHGLLYMLYPFVIVNTLLGLALFYGKNVLDISWIQSFIVGSIPDGAEINAGAKLWSTLSNPNYISGIGSVLTILFLTWAMFDRNKIRAIVNIIAALLSFATVLASLSTSGFLTIIVLIPVLLIFMFFSNKKLQSAIVFLVFILLATSVYIPMAEKNPKVWNETLGFMIKENPFVEQEAMSGNQLEQTPTKMANNDEPLLINRGIQQIFLPSKAYAEGNQTNSFDIPTLPESGISAGSGRVYIWEKTWETAMKRPILGYGLDTFVYVFPQDDIEKIAGLRTYNIIVDKPHNMYLGLLIGSGVLALLTFLLLTGWIVIKSAGVMWERRHIAAENAVPLSLFAAVLAYLIQGLFNDSVVGAAVIFWMLLGLLVSIVYQREKNV